MMHVHVRMYERSGKVGGGIVGPVSLSRALDYAQMYAATHRVLITPEDDTPPQEIPPSPEG